MCGALVERSWVLRDSATGAYSLGIRAISVGAAAAESPLVVAFRPVAADLLALHNETVHLTLLDGGDSLFVAKAETTHAVGWSPRSEAACRRSPRRAGACCSPTFRAR